MPGGNLAQAAIPNRAFPRHSRLLTGKAYSLVFQKNMRFANHHWTVLVRMEPDAGSRLGLAIAKKRAKRAVDRNRIKRVARESFRHQQVVLPGCDAVVMNRDAAASASTAELRLSIDQLWRKLRRRVQQGAV